jgi:hypothetical protein
MYVMSNNSIFRKNSLFKLSIYLLFLLLIVTIDFDYFTSFYNKSIKEEHNSYSQNKDKNSEDYYNIKKNRTRILDDSRKTLTILELYYTKFNQLLDRQLTSEIYDNEMRLGNFDFILSNLQNNIGEYFTTKLSNARENFELQQLEI